MSVLLSRVKEQGSKVQLQASPRLPALLPDWLACAAFFYPLFWLFSSMVWALPAVFRAFYDKPWFEGMYWCNVESDGGGGRENGSFTPWGKPAMGVLNRWYTEGGR